MSVQKLKCPECSAGLKSAAGFRVGQTVCCPKCETYFVVEDPEEEEALDDEDGNPKPARGAGKKSVRAAAVVDDGDEEKPKQKKKKKRVEEDEERSYKNSPVRYIVLGVLILIMLVLGFLLYLKRKNEAAAANEPAPKSEPTSEPPRNPIQPKGAPIALAKDNGKRPPIGKGPGAGPLDDLFVNGPATAAEAQKLLAKYTTELIGTWAADLGAGTKEELTYAAGGTFRATRTGPGAATVSGKYTVKNLVGTKGLKLQLDGPDGARTINVTFENNELQHPSLEKGVTATFRKK